MGRIRAPILNPRGDLGYMGFSVFRGDNRTFAIILLAPAADRERVLRHERAWRAACGQIMPLALMISPDYGRPITDVMPMGGLMNVDRSGDPGVSGVIAIGDAFCHTGVSFALAHVQALALAIRRGGRRRRSRRALPGARRPGGSRAPHARLRHRRGMGSTLGG